MLRVLPVSDTDARFADFAALDAQTPASVQAQAGRLFDRYGRRLHLLLLDDDRPVGRLTASVNPDLRTAAGATVGCIGDLAFPDDGAALDALLEPALDWLRAAGVETARAPVRYHTWYAFRFVIEGFERPPIPGEPWNPPYYPQRFRAAGFAETAHYVSGLAEDLQATVDANRAELDAFPATGLTIRTFDRARLDEDLIRLHALVTATFRTNFSFKTIDLDEFRFIHAPVLQRIDPRLFLLCEDPAKPTETPDGLAGFMLTYPDPGSPGTVVLKTLAVHPHYRGRGVGPVLIARAHEAALRLGHHRAVHAMMREGHRPATVSARAVPVFRRYALMDRAL